MTLPVRSATRPATTDPVRRDPSLGGGRLRRALPVAVSVLAVAYLLQLATPLRLNTDAVTLLTMARSAAAGQGFTVHGRPAQFPIGYPAVLLVMDGVGVAGSPAFVGLNLACLGVALWQFGRIARRELGVPATDAWGAVALSLLSCAVVKHVTIPLTEMPFAALSTSAVDAMTRARRTVTARRAAVWAAAAAALTIASIAVRTIGIALVPALAWAALTAPAVRRRAVTISGAGVRRPWAVAGLVIAAVLVIVGVAAGGVALSRTTYVRQVRSANSPAQQVRLALRCRTADLGELAVNVPALRLPAPARGLVPVAGAAFAVVLAAGLWGRRRTFGPADVYLLSYAGILAAWPYPDARFYVPVTPFLFVFAAAGLRQLMPGAAAGAAVIAAFCGWFALTGLVSLAVSTRQSWSGDRFADRYGLASTQSTYRKAFGRPPTALPTTGPGLASATESAPGPGEDDWLALLRRYEPRARGR